MIIENVQYIIETITIQVVLLLCPVSSGHAQMKQSNIKICDWCSPSSQETNFTDSKFQVYPRSYWILVLEVIKCWRLAFPAVPAQNQAM